jgi:hypothetical protein
VMGARREADARSAFCSLEASRALLVWHAAAAGRSPRR